MIFPLTLIGVVFFPPIVALIYALSLLFPSVDSLRFLFGCVMLAAFPLSIVGVMELLLRFTCTRLECARGAIVALIVGILFMIDPVRGVGLFAHILQIFNGAGSSQDIAFIVLVLGSVISLTVAVFVTLTTLQLLIELPGRWFLSASGAEEIIPWTLIRFLMMLLILGASAGWVCEEILRGLTLLYSGL